MRRRRPCRARRRAGVGRRARRRSTGSTSRAGRSSASMTTDSSSEWPTPLRVGSLAPAQSGGFIAGTDDGIAIDRPRCRTGSRSSRNPEERPSRQSLQRRQGRPPRPLLGRDDGRSRAGGDAARSTASSRTWACAAIDGGYKVTNGPAFSPSGDIMYHNDSARQVTYASTSTPPARPANRRVFLQFGAGDGYPDGMTVDAEGCLWIAFWDGWCVRRFSPTGELARRRSRCRSRGRPAARSAGRPRPALRHLGEHRPRRKRACRCNQMPGGCLWSLRECGGLPDVPFAG